MQTWRVLGILLGGLAMAPGQLAAATHQVTVGDGYFDPPFLKIAAGDTVRWVNPAWSGVHDVTADDGSWWSPQAREFVYERTFNTIGDIGYYCSLHSFPGNGPMTGIIRVESAEPVFPINAGLGDAWYNPTLAGQGFFITVWEDAKLVFLSWFTYDTTLPPGSAAAVVGDPGQRWLTAQGPYDGDTATLTVNETAGGIFGASQPQPATQAVGSMTIRWSDCSNGLLSYELPAAGLEGEIPIERIVSDKVPLCEALSTQ